MTLLWRNWAILLIVLAFVALGTVYSIVNPLFESPDEVGHYEYVRWLVEGHGLPKPEDVGNAPWHQEGSQPPLYYLLAAGLTSPISTDNAGQVIRPNPHAAVGQPASVGNKNVIVHGKSDAWPWRGVALAGHLARFLSLFLGAITVVCTYGSARLVFPDRPPVAIGAAALVAFNPQFLFLSASVNNDNLVIACSAAGVWLLLEMVGRREPVSGEFGQTDSLAARQAGPRTCQLVLLGLLVGAAALSKLSGLLLAGLAGMALLAIAWRRRSIRELIRWGLVVAVAAAGVGGWWYGRNLLLYGDPLGLQAMFDILPRRAAPPTLVELLGRAEGVWRSAWAVFGAFNIGADEWLYGVYTFLCLAGLLGLILGRPLRFFRRKLERKNDRHVSSPDPIQIILLLAWVVLVFLALLQWAQMRYPQGRLLFPALSGAAVLLSIGLFNWVPARFHHTFAVLLAAGLLALAAIAPWRWIAPAYARPDPLPLDTVLPGSLAVDFDGVARLVGYDIAEDEVFPGETLSLDLFWRALAPIPNDYSVFVHLTDQNGILQAQRDSYPGGGSLATSEWPLDIILSDHHTVLIPDTAPAPARLRVGVGLYDYTTGVRVPAGDADHWRLGYVTLLPRGDSDLPNPVFINFDDQIALMGFELGRRTMWPGDTLDLTLWWEALSVPRRDYVVFTHLVLSPDAVWAQVDNMPVNDTFHTSSWQVGERLEDHYSLTLPDNAPAGVYFLEIGLYDPVTLDRLQVNLSDRGIVLGQISVTGE